MHAGDELLLQRQKHCKRTEMALQGQEGHPVHDTTPEKTHMTKKEG